MELSKLVGSENRFIRRVKKIPSVIWVSAGCLLTAFVFALFFSTQNASSFKPSAAGKLLFTGRNFTLQPFTLMDANDLCELETREKLGESLLRYHMNPLSTRYEERKDRYFVVLNADIGTVTQWEEALIYCDVNPSAHKVAYYKEHYGTGDSFLSSTRGLFSKLF